MILQICLNIQFCARVTCSSIKDIEIDIKGQLFFSQLFFFSLFFACLLASFLFDFSSFNFSFSIFRLPKKVAGFPYKQVCCKGFKFYNIPCNLN